MKVDLRNELLVAIVEGLDPRLRVERPELDSELALLNRQADAVMALCDLLEKDPGNIVSDVTKVLQKLNRALDKRSR
jgi:hypothetical protein